MREAVITGGVAYHHALTRPGQPGLSGPGRPGRAAGALCWGWAFGNPLVFASGAWTWWMLPPAPAVGGAELGTTWITLGEQQPLGQA